MAMKNIELFDLYVGRTFARLYEQFPLGVDMDICEIPGIELGQDDYDIPRECRI